ncbi:MAG TPA: ATP-binding protein [Candidatus Hydrothermia bacterium]|nr:ATP-binding protein [Candidatus Hydrothermia bacterium]HPQ23229.1 ATP-binding protein [Candidatus Paceibacterota bacterium]
MNNHEEHILNNVLKKKDKKGNIIARESSEIEFKESFNFSNITEYSKLMASFANKLGGYIIFGIKDNPRRIVGIRQDRVNGIPQEKITSFLLEYFNPEVKWDIGIVEHDGVYVGYIYTYEAESKPIICKKNKDNIIKTGEIYYRYRAQTRNIEYGELKAIIDEIKEKERQNWMRVFKDTARIGPENVVISEKSAMDVRLGNGPKALPVEVDEKDIRKFYPYDYKQLTAELRRRYSNFKENQEYHNLRKKLKLKKEYCYTRLLDPKNPKSTKKDFYSEKIIKEFNRHYTLKD